MKHITTYHDTRMFECKECKEEFQGKHKLSNHQRQHQVRICNHCDTAISFTSMISIEKFAKILKEASTLIFVMSVITKPI